jgi:hypothetical protein
MLGNWKEFSSFMTNVEFWTRWEIIYNPESESYLVSAMTAASKGEPWGPTFDFSRTHASVISTNLDMDICWEHDGESLEYFFKGWLEGKIK